ncbi:hypothetical protein SULAZ_1281 [Sulfurihydrogenibium azorense Az-Fu1]|jgi:hypothetical protein|uniref:Uncharacterized protein n=3 Tax=Sulfurihydrogenibium azorense TaxID=309806 RepID=C1DVW3_SULAA|nr:hypothetical protein SULAZ_1281 [Sulfurihydrogenibium azorense Az-Fu1]
MKFKNFLLIIIFKRKEKEFRMEKLDEIALEIKSLEKRYSRYLKEKERVRKRQQDVHFTPKDKEILIETFVIANIVENLVSKAISRLI